MALNAAREQGQEAAVFRVEGVLVRRGALAATAFLAANSQGIRERVLRLGQVALSAPLVGLLSQNDRGLANRLTYLPLRGMSEDRLAVLGRELFDTMVRPSLRRRGQDLLERARREGRRVVLLSEALAQVVEPLAELLGADTLVCNRLEIRHGEATGKLLDPVVGGHDGGRWLRSWAEEEGVDLARSTAYAAHAGDLLLLATVGQPCAVDPDFTLRRAAREAGWPVLHLEPRP